MSSGVTVAYNGNVIHQMAGNGNFKMNTAGAYMEGDVDVVVDVAGGGGGGTKNILSGTSAPNAGDGNNGDIYLEYNKLYELPTGYTQIEYIESTGTQYIDTLVTPDQDTSIEIEFSMSALSGDKGLYGSRVSGSSRDFETHFYGASSVYVGYNSNTDIKSAWGVLQTDEKYKVYHNKNLYYKNGSLIKTFNTATFTCPYNLVIFGVRNNSANPTWLCSAKLYRFKMWNDETLVRDMIPIKDNNDVVCLYDFVSETCFYNAGSGNFNAGGNAFERIEKTYCKVNGAWQELEETDIDDVNTEGILITKAITENGTYKAEDDNADGYSQVTVNVSGGGYTEIDIYAVNFTPNSNVNGAKSGGFRFTPYTKLKVKGIRFFSRESTCHVYLSDSNGNTIATKQNVAVTADQWSDILLDSPILLDAETQYVVWGTHPNGTTLKYASSNPTSPFFSSGQGVDAINSAIDTFPNHINNVRFGVDLILQIWV